jgi:hypothetical protein
MKTEDIFLSLLREQEGDDEHELDFLDDPGDDDQGVHGFDDGEFAGGDVEHEDDPALPDERDPIVPAAAPQQRPEQQPAPPKKLTESQKIKMRWIREQPGLTDIVMDEHIQFFKERKERLRPYKPYGTIDPTTNRLYINLPEVASQMERFPNMADILKDPQRIKDIQNYSWEEISFYMDRILNLNRVIDDENYVHGDETLEEKFKAAYERWTNPRGQIVNENNTIVYRIESKNESIALGALQICIHEKYSDNAGYMYNAWCTARPEHSRYGSNMYSTYRTDYGAAFYYILDKNRKEDDIYYIAAIDVKSSGHRSATRPYTLISRKNGDDTNFTWNELVTKYPALNGKEGLFTYFGSTRKEQANFTLDRITFKPGDPYDFATLPPKIQSEYIDDKRHINEVRSFLTLEATERKLYIDKTVKTNDDYKRRYLCVDANDPYGILNAIKNVKPQDYKYLDYILKEKLGIPSGIAAIKLSILGTNWRRWLSDLESGYTLCSTRNADHRYNKVQKYGIINLDSGDVVKDMDYIAGKLQSFMNIYQDENGLRKRKLYMFQRYNRSIAGNPDPNDYFYFLSLKEALTDKASPFYLKGKFFESADGDTFVKEKLGDGTFIKI